MRRAPAEAGYCIVPVPPQAVTVTGTAELFAVTTGEVVESTRLGPLTTPVRGVRVPPLLRQEIVPVAGNWPSVFAVEDSATLRVAVVDGLVSVTVQLPV